MSKALRLWMAALAVAVVGTGTPAPAGASEPSNSQWRMPHDLYFADVDGDGIAEIVQVAWTSAGPSNKVLIYEAGAVQEAVASRYYPANVKRVVVGDFVSNGGKDELCVELVNSIMDCSALEVDKLKTYSVRFTPLYSGEDVIVGDFDGNGADDLLTYVPSTGAFRLLTSSSTCYFCANDGAASLSNRGLVNKQVLAGEFGESAARDDLVIVDRANGSLSRFDSTSYYFNGQKLTKFELVFTASGAVSTSDEARVANLDGGDRDNLVLRNRSTGRYRFVRAEVYNGALQDVPGMWAGTLPATTEPWTQIQFAKLYPSGPSVAVKRDDALFFNSHSSTITPFRATSGWWNTQSWAAQASYGYRFMDMSWPAIDAKAGRWLIVPCALKIGSGYTRPDADPSLDRMRAVLLSQGTRSLRDYFLDQSYGKIDLASSEIFPRWVTLDRTITAYDASKSMPTIEPAFPDADMRNGAIRECVAGTGGNTADYGGVIVIMNTKSFAGGPLGTALVYGSMLDTDFRGIAHEVAHAMGQPAHSSDDSGMTCSVGATPGVYCDGSDPLGSGNRGATSDPATDPIKLSERPPQMSFVNRQKLSFVPSARVKALQPGASKQTATVTLAPTNRPEANGVLGVTIPLGGDWAGTGSYATVEYRTGNDWDSINGVQVRFVWYGTPYLRTNPATELQPQQAYEDKSLKIQVVSTDYWAQTATVSITY